ncbi:MAG: hypothetical protein AAF767_10235 [Pseudomonadota bacterium]
MKRAHRTAHLALWLVLTPVMFLILVLAVLNQPEAPDNETLPAVLIEESS